MKAAVGGVVAYLDEVPDDPPYPYVVVESDSAQSSPESVGDVNELGTFHPRILVAALSPAKVRQVRDRLEALYDTATPLVGGRLVEVEKLVAGNIARDPDLARPVWWCRDQLEVRSYAA
ncbi:hypothetical protein [Dermacoccus sp. GAS27A]|uniref:tail completion protein gp17 n=1 Tax=Dermacoccus sp. GAS27A TaxID=3156270 RepID=UPI00384BF8C8